MVRGQVCGGRVGQGVSWLGAEMSSYLLESWVLTHLSTILSFMKYSCKDGLSCTVYATYEHIVNQLILFFFLY